MVPNNAVEITFTGFAAVDASELQKNMKIR